MCRWRGSGPSLSPGAVRERSEARQSKDAAWDDISNLKQKITQYTSRTPTITPSRTTLLDKRETSGRLLITTSPSLGL